MPPWRPTWMFMRSLFTISLPNLKKMYDSEQNNNVLFYIFWYIWAVCVWNFNESFFRTSPNVTESPADRTQNAKKMFLNLKSMSCVHFTQLFFVQDYKYKVCDTCSSCTHLLLLQSYACERLDRRDHASDGRLSPFLCHCGVKPLFVQLFQGLKTRTLKC